MPGWMYAAVLCAAAVFVMAMGPALAEVSRVVVRESGPMGTFGGRQYTWVTAAMEGTVEREDGTTGHYRVPVSLMYPDRDPNGFGFADVVNSADFSNYLDETAPLGKRKVSYTGDKIHSDYLRRAGFTYMSVQWARMVTEVLGPDYGVIENGEDGWEVLKDAARFFRNPDKLEGDLSFALAAVAHVVAHGYSQTGSLLKGFVQSGHNREPDGTLIFDGIMAGGTEFCRILNNDDTPSAGPGPTIPRFYHDVPCEHPFPEAGKLILIQPQSELDEYALEDWPAPPRYETANFRRYELAGVSHIPLDLNALGSLGATRQNPVSFRPVFKAMLRNLVEWIETGKEPPPPRYIEGKVGSDGRFHLATDADGNVKGGVRLPHMPTVLPNGKRVGAPLGVYGGLDPEYYEPFNAYPWLGGTFKPFSEHELKKRYPSDDTYFELVESAAAALLAERFILEEDYEAYVTSAKRGW
jgi:Alpha/beta hydrolase domain